jgi:hypothetical protein
MLHEDWRTLIESYIGTALHRAHDAGSDADAKYWKRVAHELAYDAKLKPMEIA